jgi:FMN phosphatase YigB (HAD superfamily)
MLERPLTYVKKCKDDALIALLDRTKNAGTKLIVCSDYPVKEKLEALQFTPDEAYSADDLGHMKPDAEGLTRILAKQRIDPAACLVIGDRDDKDGMLGANMGADVLILPASKKERTLIYKQLNI